MQFSFKPDKAVCSQRIDVSIENGVVESVRFYGGCPGSLKAVSLLVQGMPVKKAMELLQGVPCGNKGTSCPDQLSRALREYLDRETPSAE